MFSKPLKLSLIFHIAAVVCRCLGIILNKYGLNLFDQVSNGWGQRNNTEASVAAKNTLPAIVIHHFVFIRCVFIDWSCGSSDRVPALQVQSPEFKSHLTKGGRKEKKKRFCL
jgi:hypothetical protein